MYDSDSPLETVASGLKLVYAGLCLMVFSVLASPVAGIILGRQGPDSLKVVIGALAVLMLLASGLDIAGRLKCLAMPEGETAARPFIYASVALTGISVLLTVLDLIGRFVPGIDIPPALNFVRLPTAFLGSVTFVLFLRSLALFIGRKDLARRTVRVLVLGVLLAGCFAGVIVGTLNAAGGVQALVVASSLGMIVIGLMLLISYGNLLTYLRKAVLEDASSLNADF